MSARVNDRRTQAELREENARLRLRLEEAEQTLDAIRRSDVDALVVDGPEGKQLYTLSGADQIYRIIVETMNEAAVLLRPDGLIVFCNQRFCDLMRTPMPQTVGRSLAQFVQATHEPALRKLLADGMAGALTRRFSLCSSDGASVPVQFWVNAMLGKSEPTLCLVATDLSELETSLGSLRVAVQNEQRLQDANALLERQRIELEAHERQLTMQNEELLDAQEALTKLSASIQQEKDRLAALLRSIPDEVWCFDAQGRLELLNPAGVAAFGDLVGSGGGALNDAHEVYHPDAKARRPPEEAPPLRALAGEEVRDQEEIVRMPGTAELRVRQVNAAPVRSADGTIIGSVAVVRDITDRKRFEEELRARNAELAEFNELMVDRELRMIELKREINRLCEQSGQAARYEVSQEDRA